MKILKQHKSFEGSVRFCEHESAETKTKMAFSTFTPEGQVRGCLIWLSGLTCNDENFMAKAGAQRYLAQNQLMVVCPDTSPRGLDLPEEHDSWDFGSGAGFYVDALTKGYRDHYRMYSYVVNELYSMIEIEFKMTGKISLFGHSMGGHGALVIGLRESSKFSSVSAFSPIVNPIACDWGKKAFSGYLGTDQNLWKDYDACELLRAGKTHPRPLMIDQGKEDNFLEAQLLTQNIVTAAEQSSQELNIRMQQGYDHSYYFISTFIEDHIKFHAKHLL